MDADAATEPGQAQAAARHAAHRGQGVEAVHADAGRPGHAHEGFARPAADLQNAGAGREVERGDEARRGRRAEGMDVGGAEAGQVREIGQARRGARSFEF